MSGDVEAQITELTPLLQGSDREFEQGSAALQLFDAEWAEDAHVQYLIGSAYDSCGRQALAIVHYDRVFALGLSGLPEVRRPEIFVQSGSTLRNLGRLDEARERFVQGIAQYPEYRALRIFAAMLETRAGDHSAAARQLYAFVLMPEDGSVARYRRSLTRYIGEILGHKGGASA